MQWGDRWLATGGKPPLALVDAKSGTPVGGVAVRGKSDRPLSYREIRFAPGPGATTAIKAAIAGRNRKVLGEEG